MPRYVRSQEELRDKIAQFDERKRLDEETREMRKRRELARRKLHAALYEPRLCMGDPVSGKECLRYSIPGAGFCAEHGGTTKHMQAAAKTRLLYLVEPALRVMNKCMASGDLNIALKAAQIILDRAGFHPHATLEISEAPVDYTTMSNQQLKIRANKLLAALEDPSAPPEEPVEYEEGTVIDIEDRTEQSEQRKVH